MSPVLRPAYPYLRRGWQLSRYLLRRPHEADFAAFAKFPERTGLFLDIGGSSGTSAMSFRLFNRHSPILTVEPNAVLEPDLRFLKRVLPRFDYLIAAAGDESGSLPLYVPWFRGIPITGESSLSRESVEKSPSLADWLGDRMASPDFMIVETVVPVRRLDELALSPDFIKIDVQGAEARVLRGLDDTLDRAAPILLIERGETFDEVSGFLSERGYDPYLYDPANGELSPLPAGVSTLNVFFLAANAGRR